MSEGIPFTAYDIAERFIGVSEVPGTMDNPLVLAMLRLDNQWPTGDEVPWCSAFANFVCWLTRLPRSKSLAARSWLLVGKPVHLEKAVAAFDIVVLNRGGPTNPSEAGPGHVGFFAGVEDQHVLILGGNQSNKVCVSRFPLKDLLGVRRLYGQVT